MSKTKERWKKPRQTLRRCGRGSEEGEIREWNKEIKMIKICYMFVSIPKNYITYANKKQKIPNAISLGSKWVSFQCALDYINSM